MTLMGRELHPRLTGVFHVASDDADPVAVQHGVALEFSGTTRKPELADNQPVVLFLMRSASARVYPQRCQQRE
jgi:hypothetical protein